MKIFLAITAFVLILLFVNGIGRNKQLQTPTTADSTTVISISAVGDLMCHSVEFDYAEAAPDSFNFNPFFKEITPYIRKADFAFGNLETVLAGAKEKYSGYPNFNSPDAFAEAVKNAGFNLVTTSNNHALDQGEKGVLRTLSVLKKIGLDYAGTYSTEHDADSLRIFNIKGIKLAFLAYSYGTNGHKIPTDKDYLISIIDTNKVKNRIALARRSGAEVVLVYYHFGQEYQRQPNQFQKDIVDATIRAGADLIIASHPHVIQPVEFFKTEGGSLDTGLVAYSLGNFISNQRWRYSDAGVIITLHITKDFKKDSLYLSGVTYLPTWVFKGSTGAGRKYLILPDEPNSFSELPEFLSSSDRAQLNQAFYDTKKTVTKYSKEIRLTDIIDAHQK